MPADRPCGPGRPLGAGMVVGCEEAAGASAAASGCCPPRPSQGIAPGSVRPCWPPGCLQRRRGCGRGVRRAQLTGWARVVLAGWRLTVWPWLLLLLSRLSVADGADGQGSRRVSTTPHARRSTQILATGAAPICCRPACLISGRSAASQLGPAPLPLEFLSTPGASRDGLHPARLPGGRGAAAAAGTSRPAPQTRRRRRPPTTLRSLGGAAPAAALLSFVLPAVCQLLLQSTQEGGEDLPFLAVVQTTFQTEVEMVYKARMIPAGRRGRLEGPLTAAGGL